MEESSDRAILHTPARRGWISTGLIFALVYPAAGLLFPLAVHQPASAPMRVIWRLVPWVLSLAAVLSQVLFERLRLHSTVRQAAWHTAAAAAFGGLLMAAAGPARGHWGTATQQRGLAALFLWPVIMAVPAFVVALGFGAAVGRLRTPR